MTKLAERVRARFPHERMFFLLDCVTTLGLYNEQRQLGQFLHSLNMKLRKLRIYEVVCSAAATRTSRR
ncbi:MAG: hypothetical protein QXH27_01390 [Candidatus Micrarchaeia archaeon]